MTAVCAENFYFKNWVALGDTRNLGLHTPNLAIYLSLSNLSITYLSCTYIYILSIYLSSIYLSISLALVSSQQAVSLSSGQFFILSSYHISESSIRLDS